MDLKDFFESNAYLVQAFSFFRIIMGLQGIKFHYAPSLTLFAEKNGVENNKVSLFRMVMLIILSPFTQLIQTYDKRDCQNKAFCQMIIQITK